MSTVCCAINCQNGPLFSPSKDKADRPASFHRFPEDKVLREKWVNAIGKGKFINKKINYLCSKHFVEDDILLTYFEKSDNAKEVRMLKKNAVPSIFDYSIPKSNKGKILLPRRLTEAKKPTPYKQKEGGAQFMTSPVECNVVIQEESPGIIILDKDEKLNPQRGLGGENSYHRRCFLGKDKGQEVILKEAQPVKIGSEDSNENGSQDVFSCLDNLPIIAPVSPPRPLTLCPLTGKVLGKAEGEKTPDSTPPSSPKPPSSHTPTDSDPVCAIASRFGQSLPKTIEGSGVTRGENNQLSHEKDEHILLVVPDKERREAFKRKLPPAGSHQYINDGIYLITSNPEHDDHHYAKREGSETSVNEVGLASPTNKKPKLANGSVKRNRCISVMKPKEDCMSCQRMLAEHTKKEESIQNKNESLKSKLRKMQKSINRNDKTLKALKDKMESPKRGKRDIAKMIEESVRENLSGMPCALVLSQMKNYSKKHFRFCEEVKDFALKLHTISDKSYKYVNNAGFILPKTSSVKSWHNKWVSERRMLNNDNDDDGKNLIKYLTELEQSESKPQDNGREKTDHELINYITELERSDSGRQDTVDLMEHPIPNILEPTEHEDESSACVNALEFESFFEQEVAKSLNKEETNSWFKGIEITVLNASESDHFLFG